MGRGLKHIGFPNVSIFRDRHGKVRYRYQKSGRTVYLRGLPGSPEFAESYTAAVESRPPEIGASRTKPGSVNALAVLAYGSAEWARLKPTTQTTYRGIIERLRTEFGDFPLRDLRQAHVMAMRDKRAAAPTAANNLVKVLRWLLDIAVSRQWRTDNPARGVRPLKIESDGFHTWTEEEIAAFEKRWPFGTKERLAFDLLLYTAQRSGDVRRMGRQHIRDGFVSVRQEKTGQPLELPVHPRLRASLEAWPSGHLTFIVTQHGQPYTAKGFGNWFNDAAKAAGVTRGTAHGLRKAAARRLAEAGCTAHQIMAVTGHRTLKEAERYTRAAAQRHLATAAYALIGGTEVEHNPDNPPDRLSKSSAK